MANKEIEQLVQEIGNNVQDDSDTETDIDLSVDEKNFFGKHFVSNRRVLPTLTELRELLVGVNTSDNINPQPVPTSEECFALKKKMESDEKLFCKASLAYREQFKCVKGCHAKVQEAKKLCKTATGKALKKAEEKLENARTDRATYLKKVLCPVSLLCQFA